MTRLMCSHDRKEVEELKSKLFRAGIRSEVRSNPLTNALGILRLEIHIHESDLIDASRIHQEFLAAQNSDSVSKIAETSGTNGSASRKKAELLVEPMSPAPTCAQIGVPNQSDLPLQSQQDRSGNDLANAAVLLEKEVEEVLARDQRLAQQCAALQDQIKALDESLKQAQAELSRQSSDRSAAEQKVAEVSASRGALEKELESINQRLKTTEQSLTAAHGRLESQTRELKLQESKVGDLSKEVASRDSQLNKVVESLDQMRAALENEKGLRQIAEQEASEHAAARQSLEQQVNHFAELQARNQHDREQVQTYLDTVNKLRSRLNQKRTAP